MFVYPLKYMKISNISAWKRRFLKELVFYYSAFESFVTRATHNIRCLVLCCFQIEFYS